MDKVAIAFESSHKPAAPGTSECQRTAKCLVYERMLQVDFLPSDNIKHSALLVVCICFLTESILLVFRMLPMDCIDASMGRLLSANIYSDTFICEASDVFNCASDWNLHTAATHVESPEHDNSLALALLDCCSKLEPPTSTTPIFPSFLITTTITKGSYPPLLFKHVYGFQNGTEPAE
jgi:hypothetical protein